MKFSSELREPTFVTNRERRRLNKLTSVDDDYSEDFQKWVSEYSMLDQILKIT